MAKGVEDTAFYHLHTLTSTNEVGGNPFRASISADDLTAWIQNTTAHWPVTMTTLTTHDTKRGEDTRAAISVLTEWPTYWRSLVTRLRAHAADRPWDIDGQIENLMWQTIAGTWREDGPIEIDRLVAYLEKASREQKSWTTWTDPAVEQEQALSIRMPGPSCPIRRRSRIWPMPTNSRRSPGRSLPFRRRRWP